MAKKIVLLSAFVLALGVVASNAVACWDNSDRIILQLKKLNLSTEQIKDVFLYQKEHKDVVVRVAEALLERETLDAEDLKILKDGGELPTRPLRAPTTPETSEKAETPPTPSAQPTRPITAQPEEGPASA